MAQRSKRSLEGYLLIDNRLAPSVPGFGDTPGIAAGATFESATITCNHCNRVVILNPNRSRPRTYCAKCDHYICDVCAAVGECRPLVALRDKLQKDAERGR